MFGQWHTVVVDNSKQSHPTPGSKSPNRDVGCRA